MEESIVPRQQYLEEYHLDSLLWSQHGPHHSLAVRRSNFDGCGVLRQVARIGQLRRVGGGERQQGRQGEDEARSRRSPGGFTPPGGGGRRHAPPREFVYLMPPKGEKAQIEAHNLQALLRNEKMGEFLPLWPTGTLGLHDPPLRSMPGICLEIVLRVLGTIQNAVRRGGGAGKRD
jgi:hypothetical protein